MVLSFSRVSGLHSMKRYRATRLKLTDTAASDLRRLRMTPGDLDLIIAFGRALDGANLKLIVFTADQCPPQKRPQKLDGVIVIIDTRGNEICALCQDLLEVIEWRNQRHDGLPHSATE
jgi:hypothetical protein